MSAYDEFTQIAGLEEFEAGVYRNGEADDVQLDRENAFMETLFDFDMADDIEEQETVAPVANDQDNADWDIDDVL